MHILVRFQTACRCIPKQHKKFSTTENCGRSREPIVVRKTNEEDFTQVERVKLVMRMRNFEEHRQLHTLLESEQKAQSLVSIT